MAAASRICLGRSTGGIREKMNERSFMALTAPIFYCAASACYPERAPDNKTAEYDHFWQTRRVILVCRGRIAGAVRITGNAQGLCQTLRQAVTTQPLELLERAFRSGGDFGFAHLLGVRAVSANRRRRASVRGWPSAWDATAKAMRSMRSVRGHDVATWRMERKKPARTVSRLVCAAISAEKPERTGEA